MWFKLIIGLFYLSVVHGDSPTRWADCTIARNTFPGNYVKEWGPGEKFSVQSYMNNNHVYVQEEGQIMLSDETFRRCEGGKWDPYISQFSVHNTYRLEKKGKHPVTAIGICEQLDSTLATVDGPEHNKLMVMFMEWADVDFALIGYTDMAVEGYWEWLDGSDSKWTNWYRGQPNDGGSVSKGEDMTAIFIKSGSRNYYGQWFDVGPPLRRNQLINDGKNLRIPFWCQKSIKINPNVEPATPVRLRATLDKETFNSVKGLLEVYYEGTWGTVCQDKFDDNAAKVVCGMLGNYRGGRRIKAVFYGVDTILFDNLVCNGHEASLFDCYHTEVEEHDCWHSEDVWVECFGSKCPAGRYMDTESGVCEQCGPGHYQNQMGQSYCKPCGTGRFQPRSGGRQCIRCPLGTQSSQGSTNCEQCPPGTTQATQGTPCTPCEEGTFNPDGGSGACHQCVLGEYQDESGKANCKKCPSGSQTLTPGATRQSDCISSGEHECGKRQMGFADGQSRIVGGELAKEGEYPWQVSIASQSDYTEFCGGTLIDHDTVITAAHCTHTVSHGLFCGNPKMSRGLDDPCPWRELSDMRVIIGVTDKNDEAAFDQSVIAGITAIYVAKNYGYINGILKGDLAILKLDRSVAYTDRIQPACLPDKNDQFKNYEPLVVTGFGFTSDNGLASVQLRKVTVPWVQSSECTSVMENRVSEDMFCAGFRTGRKDACQGDSGGPIGREDRWNNKFTLVGIISWGEGCARPNKYGVYTDLFQMMDWVEDVMEERIEAVVAR